MPDLLEKPGPRSPAMAVGRWHTRFPERLKAVMERLDVPDLEVHTFETRPGVSWQYDAAAVSPAFRGVRQSERTLPMFGLMLEHLWDEQSRVGGLFAYTPEEWAELSGGDGDG